MTRTQYDPKTDAALDRVCEQPMTREDFGRLALACLDQAGMSMWGQKMVLLTLEIDSLEAQS